MWYDSYLNEHATLNAKDDWSTIAFKKDDQGSELKGRVRNPSIVLGSPFADNPPDTLTLGRRAFQKMIKDAESSPCPFDIIAVYDIKRFGRIDNDEAGYYRYLLRTHGIEIRYVSENFNGDSTDDLLRNAISILKIADGLCRSSW